MRGAQPVGAPGVLALQRSAGNQAVVRMLESASGSTLQRKLPKGLTPGTPVVHHTDGGDETGFTIQKVVVGTYTIDGVGGPYKGISTGNTAWSTVEGAEAGRAEWMNEKVKKEQGAAAEKLRQELIVGENYLSADYRRINPLLAALELHGYTAAQVRDKGFDYSAKKSAILESMREIAVTRKYADESGAAAWTVDEVDTVYRMLRTILDVWEKFPTPQAPGGGGYRRVYRGDSRFLYDSFPKLNPTKNGYPDGENAVNLDVVMPGILSTTYADPKGHNYVKGKTIVWDIELPEANEGKALGQNNQSEHEISFPIGMTLQVSSILVRVNDKTQEADRYGTDAEIIVRARMKPPSG